MNLSDLVYHLWTKDHLGTSTTDTSRLLDEYECFREKVTPTHVPTHGTTTYCMTALTLALMYPNTKHLIVVANTNMQAFIRNRLLDLYHEMEPIFGHSMKVNNRDTIGFHNDSHILIRVMTHERTFRGLMLNSIFVDNHPFTSSQLEQIEYMLPVFRCPVFRSAVTRW